MRPNPRCSFPAVGRRPLNTAAGEIPFKAQTPFRPCDQNEDGTPSGEYDIIGGAVWGGITNHSAPESFSRSPSGLYLYTTPPR